MNNRHLHTTKNRFVYLASLLMMGIFVLTACTPAATLSNAQGGEQAVVQVLSTPVPEPTTLAPAEPTISIVTDARLGQILVGDKGMTLYIFTKDGPDQSNCNEKCLSAWPPLITQGNPTLGAGVDASLVGTAALADGRKIVTYNQMPLYYYVKDTRPGDTTGQDVGQVWYVISPDGKVVDSDSTVESAPSATPIALATLAPATEVATVVATAAMTEPNISVASSPTLGKFLVGDKGMTLYIFRGDEPNQSNCTGECLAAWPPLLTDGNPTLGDGVDASLVGTATLADGTKIVTYNKMPLYYFVDDFKPGDTNGEGFHGVWYVISPSGKLIPLALYPTQKPSNEGTGGRDY